MNVSIYSGKRNYKKIKLEGNILSHCNEISSAIAYMTFPDGYFNEVKIELTEIQLKELLKGIRSIPFDKWKSDEEVGCIGASYQSFNCEYKDGKKFKYTTRFTPPESFYDMFAILSKYCEFSEDELIKLGLLEEVYVPREIKTTIEVQCYHCEHFFYDDAIFCPFCGKVKKIIEGKQREVVDERFEETVTLCSHCGNYCRCIYRYCPSCGKSLNLNSYPKSFQ